MSPLRGYCSPSEAEESDVVESKHYRSPSEAEESDVEESKHYRSPSEVEESMPYNFSSGKPTTL
jgi:hypothetical protein